MIEKKRLGIGFMLTAMTTVLILGLVASPALAQVPVPLQSDNDTCITCHEDLYLLHDTGNWFCLNAPMTCADCHGGNANTLVMQDAHTEREPHPVLNGDVSKCQECHPELCDERVAIFDEVAGINTVKVSEAYAPQVADVNTTLVPVTGQEVTGESLVFRVTVGAVAILAVLLAFYVVFIRR